MASNNSHRRTTSGSEVLEQIIGTLPQPLQRKLSSVILEQLTSTGMNSSPIEYISPLSAKPRIAPLPFGYLPEDTMLYINKFIGDTLAERRIEGSYGGVFLISVGASEPIPGIRFGFPDDTDMEVPQECPLPVYVVRDHILPAVRPFSWSSEPVKEFRNLDIGALSLGEEWNAQEAGSFGGWIREKEGSRVYGLTAAHVLPNGVGNTVTFPSCREITRRLDLVSKYTSHAAHPRMPHHQSKDHYQQEADDLLQKFRIRYDEAGVELAADVTRNVSMLLTGSVVGKVRVHRFGSGFIHSPEIPSRIDYALFESTNPAKTGRNLTVSRYPAPIAGICDFTDGETVTKYGRTTGVTTGSVSLHYLQAWVDGSKTLEQVICGDNPPCAANGDSGAAVVSTREGELFCGALLHGVNTQNDLALYTPMRWILEDLGDQLGFEVDVVVQ